MAMQLLKSLPHFFVPISKRLTDTITALENTTFQRLNIWVIAYLVNWQTLDQR